MLVQKSVCKAPLQVYGIYWVGNERFYWVVPYEGYGGLSVLSDKEVNVVDASLSSDLILCKDGDGKDMILHWAAEDILEDLAECDPIAMTEFLRRLQTC